MKLCWLQAELLGFRFMQTSTRTPREIIPKIFSRGIVTNKSIYCLLESDYQKSVKSMMAANDSRKGKCYGYLVYT